MERLQDFYIFTLPFFVLGNILLAQPQKQYCQYIFIVLNMMLVLHALYEIRVLIGVVQFMRAIGGVEHEPVNWNDYLNENILGMVGRIVLPFLFLVKYFRANIWVSVMVYFLVLKKYTTMGSQPQEIFFVMAYGTSVFAIVYALFWLFKLFPSLQKTN